MPQFFTGNYLPCHSGLKGFIVKRANFKQKKFPENKASVLRMGFFFFGKLLFRDPLQLSLVEFRNFASTK